MDLEKQRVEGRGSENGSALNWRKGERMGMRETPRPWQRVHF